MNQNTDNVWKYADTLIEKHLDPIEKDLKERINVKSKLIYLTRKIDEIKNILYTTVPNLKTEIKTNLVNAHNNDKLAEYLSGEQHKDDLTKLKKTYKKNYGKYITEYNDNRPDLFVKVNSDLLPVELLESFILSNTVEISQLPSECITGVIIGFLKLHDILEDKIEDIISENHLTREDLIDLENRYGTKIRWNKTVKEIAKLFNMLFFSGHVDFDKGSGSEKANAIFLHFQIGGRTSGSKASLRTIKTAFEQTVEDAKIEVESMIKILG
jgi:hypothetical protein